MAATTLSDRALVRASGEDVRGFLQGLVTQDASAIAPGAPQWAGLLTPQGKALFDFILWDDGDAVLIDCEAGRAEALVRRLSLYRLRRAIDFAAVPDLAVHWSREDGEGTPDPRLPELGRRWLAPPGEAAQGWRAHRLRMGVAEGVAELGDGQTLWLECNAAELNGVSFTKGCYVGQENVARMNWRQKVNRRLATIETDTDPGEAANAWYPELGLAVARLRVEQLGGPVAIGEPIIPGWLRAALA